MGNIRHQSEKNLGQGIKHQTFQHRSLIPLYVSLFIWIWDIPSSGWQIDGKLTYTYDANNQMSSELFTGDSSWLRLYTYDANNKLISLLQQDWSGSDWENNWLNTYNYDASNNRISELYQIWNGSFWWNYFRNIHIFDENNFLISNSNKGWNNDGTVNYGDSIYSYYHTIVGINDLNLPDESIAVYPNPSSSQITIELTATPDKSTCLTIIDITGKQIITHQITEQQTLVDVSGLSQGIYFVRVADDRTVMVGKFVKQ